MSNLLLTITFHGIGPVSHQLDPGEDRVWCSVDLMSEILDLVRDRRDVRITADDGNRSDLAILAPALAERGLTADFFVLAGRLDSPHYLSAEDLCSLRSMGMRVGLHGWDHVPWKRLDETGWQRELVDAKSRLEDCVNAPITAAACPFGAYGRETISRLKHAGIQEIFTSDGGWSTEGRSVIARNSAGPSSGTEHFRSLLAKPCLPWKLQAKRFVKRLR